VSALIGDYWTEEVHVADITVAPDEMVSVNILPEFDFNIPFEPKKEF
jgi:hypothetical protein